MKILGISAFYHDSAAALVDDGVILAAAQEERFSRVKHDASFPEHAIRYCLQEAGCTLADVDTVVFYEAPEIKRGRQMRTFMNTAPRGAAGFQRFVRRLFMERRDPLQEIRAQLAGAGLLTGREPAFIAGGHHLSHAASAFYPSPFEEAAILTVDGVGEWDTTTICAGRGATIERLAGIEFPDSLGLLYSAVTSYCGFKVNDGEYKLMGLAPYGRPVFAQRIRDELIDLKDDGSFHLNMRYFDFLAGTRMYSPAFETLFDGPARTKDQPVAQRHMDVAASLQAVVEEAMLALVKHAVAEAGSRNLCLAGGVALNCVANGKILRSGLIDRLWIQPAAGDAGGAVGCALQAYYERPGAVRQPKTPDGMAGSRLGPAYSKPAIHNALQKVGAVFSALEEEKLIDATARALAEGQVIGWFDGRMEFGPRALGGRSILGDPRRADMQSVLNLKVKFRESFRPFAPIVLAEEAANWFEIQGESPYMLIVAPVLERHRRILTPEQQRLTGFERLPVERSSIPAVTHVDYSARVQTVDRERAPRLHRLLTAFYRITGVPVLINTSFNVNDEPIVCSPMDAYRCLIKTRIDKLVIGNCVVDREAQPQAAVDRALSTSPGGQAGTVPDDFLYTIH